MVPPLTLRIRPEQLCIVRLAAGTPLPDWLPASGLVSFTRTETETSIVCAESGVPEHAGATSHGWRALEVAGPLALDEVGVLSQLARPLAEAGISIFVLSTYATDIVLVKATQLEAAVRALNRADVAVET